MLSDPGQTRKYLLARWYTILSSKALDLGNYVLTHMGDHIHERSIKRRSGVSGMHSAIYAASVRRP